MCPLRLCHAHHCLHVCDRYGHVWPDIVAFFCWLVLPYLEARSQQDSHHLILPVGAHLSFKAVSSAAGQLAFQEVEALFSSAHTGLRISRAPWVPFCGATTGGRDGEEGLLGTPLWLQQLCCLTSGEVPLELRGRVHLLSGFPGSQKRLVERNIRPRDAHAFRATVRPSLLSGHRTLTRLPPVALNGPSASRSIVWLLASNGTNGRRIHDEEALVTAVREWLRQHRPTWVLRALSPEVCAHALSCDVACVAASV